MADHLLGGQNLRLEYPNKVVFEDVTVGVNAGDRIGVVGRNGDGKTSLIQMILGRIDPHDGEVIRRGGIRVGVLDQEDRLDPDATVSFSVVGDRPEFEWAGDAKIRDVLSGLLSDIPWDSKVGELSGGQRRRVALAALLAQDWDVLGLDEPTNHLDVEGINWLASHLKNRWPKNQGALLVVTHDRWFLDAVTTSTWEVHDAIVEPFEGGYAAYILQRVERDRMAAASEAKRQNLLRKELAWLRRGAPARTSKPRFRLDAAAELIAGEPPVRDSLELARVATARIGKRVVDLVDVSAGYGDKQVLRDVTWRIAPGERTGILGANGSGKSTLLALISGDLEQTNGRITPGKTVKISVLDQNFSQLSNIGKDRVREVLARHKTTFSIDGKDVTPAQLLERLGFKREYMSSPVDDLSGGQKRRLQLLLTLLEEPNLLILDEPTNDLDTDMLTALEDLLDSWAGTLIVVSHDRYLIERVTDQQYAIIGGRLRHLPGGVDQYLELRDAHSSSNGAAFSRGAQSDAANAGEPPGAGTSSSSMSGAERRTLEKELAATERKIEKLGKQVESLEQKMANYDQADFQGLAELTGELHRLSEEKDTLEEHWLELGERLG